MATVVGRSGRDRRGVVRHSAGSVGRVPRADLPCRFDPVEHAYYLGDRRVPSITQLLKAAGKIDATWYTPEAAARGTAVHALCAAHALGSLSVEEYEGPLRPYLLAYDAAVGILKPSVTHVELPVIHRGHGFGGRIDLGCILFGRRGLVEIKTGAWAAWHGVQLALQAELLSQDIGVPAKALARRGLYLRPDGKYRVHTFEDSTVRDFQEAHSILAAFAGKDQPWEPVDETW